MSQPMPELPVTMQPEDAKRLLSDFTALISVLERRMVLHLTCAPDYQTALKGLLSDLDTLRDSTAEQRGLSVKPARMGFVR